MSETPRRVVLVHFHSHITPETDQRLRALERAGIEVRRCSSPSLDRGRSQMTSQALRDGFESMLWIDADIVFDPADAIRLLDDPEPVLAGCYCKRGGGDVAATFPDAEVLCGATGGRYPALAVGAGFLRIRAEVLRAMIDRLELPLCREPGSAEVAIWPFFLPLVAQDPHFGPLYLTEDYSFCHRCHQIGVKVVVDTRIRLGHLGLYPFQFEDISHRDRFTTVQMRRSDRAATWGFAP